MLYSDFLYPVIWNCEEKHLQAYYKAFFPPKQVCSFVTLYQVGDTFHPPEANVNTMCKWSEFRIRNFVFTYWSLGYLNYKLNHKYDVVRVLGGKLLKDVLPTLLPYSGDVRTLMFLAGRLANFPLFPGTKPDLVMRCLACFIAHIDTKRSAFDILDMVQTQRPEGQQKCQLIQ